MAGSIVCSVQCAVQYTEEILAPLPEVPPLSTSPGQGRSRPAGGVHNNLRQHCSAAAGGAGVGAGGRSRGQEAGAGARRRRQETGAGA